MRAFFLLALLLVIVNVITAFQHVPMAEKSLLSIRDDFKIGAKVDGKTQHQVVFAVKQRNLDLLEKTLFEVSDPTNPKYGKYLTREQVGAMTANREATLKIQRFLNEHGATVIKTTPYGEYITVTAPVSTWSEIFGTTFHYFHHEDPTAQPVIRAMEYSLPQELAAEVEGVFNTVQLPPQMTSRPAPKMKGVASTPSVTPALLNSYYNIFTNSGNNQSSQALFESLGQYYSPADLTAFQTNYNLPVEPVAYDIGGFVSDSECVADANNCAEANLDVQYIMAISQSTPTTYWYEDATDSFLAWILAVVSTANPPLVNSISYGAVEPSLPKSVANAFNTEAMKLGTQGVTITVSSGDDGVANFQARTNPKKCAYNPSFPASSPYVLAVGATQGPESGTTEIACTSDQGGVITTGGGFSTIFAAPSYQSSAISGYFSGLSSSQQPAAGYVATGRGYPDVSMAGYNYEVVIGGKTYMVSSFPSFFLLIMRLIYSLFQ